MGKAAELIVLLRDGVMTGGCLTDPQRAAAAFLDGVEGLLGPPADSDQR